MKGRVVSYVTTKKYGFVTGDDGETYFLHFSDLFNKFDEEKLIKGVRVEFEPIPTPKGLSAKKVKVPEVHFKKKLTKFFVSRKSLPKYGCVVNSHSISTRFFKDLNEGREHIKHLAMKSGCNAILELSFERDTFSDDNYHYTVHAFKGKFALVVEMIPCDNAQIQLDSHRSIEELSLSFDEKFKEVKAIEDNARVKQFAVPKSYGIGYWVFVIIIILFIFFSIPN